MGESKAGKTASQPLTFDGNLSNKKVYSQAGKYKEKGFDTRAESGWHNSAGKIFPV